MLIYDFLTHIRQINVTRKIRVLDEGKISKKKLSELNKKGSQAQGIADAQISNRRGGGIQNYNEAREDF